MLLPLSLPSLTLSASLPPRQLLPTGQTIKQDVLNIHNAVLALDVTIESFFGTPLPTSLIEGTPVLLGVVEIHKVNRVGFYHALGAVPFSEEDSVDVIDAVVDTGSFLPFPPASHQTLSSYQQSICTWILTSVDKVNISISGSIEHLKAKAPAFKEGGLTITVIASLKLLLYDHDTFSAATSAKMNPGIDAGKASEGNEAVENIHDVIEGGIQFFEGDLARGRNTRKGKVSCFRVAVRGNRVKDNVNNDIMPLRWHDSYDSANFPKSSPSTLSPTHVSFFLAPMTSLW